MEDSHESDLYDNRILVYSKTLNQLKSESPEMKTFY